MRDHIAAALAPDVSFWTDASLALSIGDSLHLAIHSVPPGLFQWTIDCPDGDPNDNFPRLRGANSTTVIRSVRDAKSGLRAELQRLLIESPGSGQERLLGGF